MSEIKQAIEWLKNLKIAYEIESDDAESQAYENEDAQVIRETYNHLARLTGIAIKALQDQQWINRENNPKQAGVYLVYYYMKIAESLDIQDYPSAIELMYYSKKNDKWATNSIVTHWKQLPQAPMEGE